MSEPRPPPATGSKHPIHPLCCDNTPRATRPSGPRCDSLRISWTQVGRQLRTRWWHREPHGQRTARPRSPGTRRATTAHAVPRRPPRQDGRRRLRARGAGRDGAADASDLGPARHHQLGDRLVHLHLGGVRDRSGRGRHRRALVHLRRAGHPRAHPGGRTRHHDPGLAAGDARGAQARTADAPQRADRDQEPGARRHPLGGRRGHRPQPHHRTAHLLRAHRPVRVRVRATAGARRLLRGLPRRLRVQQRRVLPVPGQPPALRHRPAGLPAGAVRGGHRRTGIPRAVRDRQEAARETPTLDAPRESHPQHLRRTAAHRRVRLPGLRVEQPGDPRLVRNRRQTDGRGCSTGSPRERRGSRRWT